MSEEIKGQEGKSDDLLSMFQTLFQKIKFSDNAELAELATRIKRQIFNKLITDSAIPPDLSYDDWDNQFFSSPEQPSNHSLLLLAKAQDVALLSETEVFSLLSETELSDFLKQKLKKLIAARTKLNLGQNGILSEARRIVQSTDTLTRDEFMRISDHFMREVYGH